jgi:hypothetical protein
VSANLEAHFYQWGADAAPWGAWISSYASAHTEFDLELLPTGPGDRGYLVLFFQGEASVSSEAALIHDGIEYQIPLGWGPASMTTFRFPVEFNEPFLYTLRHTSSVSSYGDSSGAGGSILQFAGYLTEVPEPAAAIPMLLAIGLMAYLGRARVRRP